MQDPRGRFTSDGEFRPYVDEAADTADTIRWAASLAGANGKVATYGFSYPGASQLLGAAEQPPELACIARGLHRQRLLRRLDVRRRRIQPRLHRLLGGTATRAPGCPQERQPRRRDRSRLAGKRLPRPVLDAAARKLSAAPGGWRRAVLLRLARDYTRDDYWKAISICERYDRIVVPALHYGGWYDTFVEGTLENYRALAERAGDDPARLQRLLIGPRLHIPWAPINGVRNFGDEARNALDEIQLEWFDYWLKGTGDVLDRPPVRLFVMGENRWRDYYGGRRRTRGSRSGISGRRGARPRSPGRSPHSRGAGRRAADVFVYNPGWPVPSAGGRSAASPTSRRWSVRAELRRDSQRRPRVLVGPARARAEATGTVELILYAATDTVDTDWTAKFVDVDEQGHAINLCDGIVRARYRESLENPTPIEPGRVYEYRIRVGSTATLFRQGHRIRLEVSRSNFPMFDINPNNGQRSGDATLLQAKVATQAVFHDGGRPSRLLLPVVPR